MEFGVDKKELTPTLISICNFEGMYILLVVVVILHIMNTFDLSGFLIYTIYVYGEFIKIHDIINI